MLCHTTIFQNTYIFQSNRFPAFSTTYDTLKYFDKNDIETAESTECGYYVSSRVIFVSVTAVISFSFSDVRNRKYL